MKKKKGRKGNPFVALKRPERNSESGTVCVGKKNGDTEIQKGEPKAL